MGTQNNYQPDNMPSTVKMIVRGIPTIIDYKGQQIITPNVLEGKAAREIGRYLVREGFLEYPNNKENQ